MHQHRATRERWDVDDRMFWNTTGEVHAPTFTQFAFGSRRHL